MLSRAVLTFQSSDTIAPVADAIPTARALAREAVIEQLVAEGRRQLAEHGAAGLSLRAIARELGMVSSAVYRYVSSRDDLLTLLIIDAYDSLGEVAEQAVVASSRRAPRNRWVDVALAIRGWALEHPHLYALVYGSPVPGYQAPPTTTASGTRVSLALIEVVRAAAADATLQPTLDLDLSASLRADLAALRPLIDLDVDDDVLAATLIAWTQLFGLVSFELFGQTRGVITDHEAMFRTSAEAMARSIGL